MRVLVGTRKGTFFVEKQAGSWKLRLAGHAGVGVNFVTQDPHSGTLWAALGHGHWGAKLSRSTDDGATWADASQIKYPTGARYLSPPDPDPNASEEDMKRGPTLRDATLLKLWVIAFGAPGQIHVGTIPGGLFSSSDDGQSFELNRALWNHESRGGDLFSGPGTGVTHWFGTPASDGEFAAGIHSIVVDPRTPERILVAISTAGVLETIDGGKTWQSRNQGMLNDYLPNPAAEWGHDPHSIAQCTAEPECLWQQNHSGVFYSRDGAQTWQKVSRPEHGVHFGFPVAVAEHDGKTAWLVPGKSDMQRTTIDGKLFVARTRDGGQTWQALRNGLPQESAYDVVYRHALAQRDGCLAFGSTTGNLYLSEDGGDSWLTASNNLPPVYSVRFG
jgi:photosystem II stability/assembly factor-like uncharacterized protein